MIICLVYWVFLGIGWICWVVDKCRILLILLGYSKDVSKKLKVDRGLSKVGL